VSRIQSQALRENADERSQKGTVGVFISFCIWALSSVRETSWRSPLLDGAFRKITMVAQCNVQQHSRLGALLLLWLADPRTFFVFSGSGGLAELQVVSIVCACI